MMKRSFAVMVLVGCGAKPAEPLAVPAPLARNEPQLASAPPDPADGRVASKPGLSEPMFPRPVIDIAFDPPELAELGRWPLTVAEHPALDPSFDIAGALAAPGVTWTDLCARGAQHRKVPSHQELVTYLDAWCSVASSDYSDALVKLGHLRYGADTRVAQALKRDVASLAAAHGPAHDLESFLRSGGFLNVEQVDLVSASYFEVGKLDDASEANMLAETMDYAPSETARCARMLRAIADASNDDREDAIVQLQRLAYPPSSSAHTPHCQLQYEQVACSNHHDCSEYWRRLVPGVSDAEAVKKLARTYVEWNRNHDEFDWFQAADRLIGARPLRERYALLLPAIDLALRTTSCSTGLMRDLEAIANRGLSDLAPERRLTTYMTRAEAYAEVQRAEQVAKMTTNEVKIIEARLARAVEIARNLEGLHDTDCRDARAKLPPVQP